MLNVSFLSPFKTRNTVQLVSGVSGKSSEQIADMPDSYLLAGQTECPMNNFV